MGILWFLTVSVVVTSTFCIVLDHNLHTLSLFEWVYTIKLESRVSETCNLTEAVTVVKQASREIPDLFDPTLQEIEFLQSCVLKTATTKQLKWFCLDGISSVLRGTRQGTLEYIVVRHDFFVNTAQVWNPRNNTRFLVHYEVEKDEDKLQNMEVRVEKCIPFLTFLHYGFFPTGPVINVFVDQVFEEQLGGMITGIIGKDRSKDWSSLYLQEMKGAVSGRLNTLSFSFILLNLLICVVIGQVLLRR